MNRRRSLISAFIFGLMLILPFPAISSPEAGETVIKRGIISDDYYAAGGKIDIDADIIGDLVVTGGDLLVGHRIQGDVMAAGGVINLAGEVVDDVRIAGGEINIDATIGDDLIAAGGEVRISSRASTGGEAWLAGGDVQMDGSVSKSLFIAAGNIRISGKIQGDVVLEGGEIQILEGAFIEGDLHYKSPNEAEIHPDVKIIGNVIYEQEDWGHAHKGYSFVFSLMLVTTAIVLFLLFPTFTQSASARVSANPWKNLGVGFILLIVTPIAAIILMGTVLGLWVGLSIFTLYFVALLVGFLVACFFLGDWGARLLHKDITTTGRRLLSVTLAILLLGLVQLIPLIGCVLIFVLLLVGLGAVMLQLKSVYRSSDQP